MTSLDVIFGGHIFIDLTVQISCFVTIYIIIRANTQLNLIVFRVYDTKKSL